MSIICTNCKARISEDFIFCCNCGAKLEQNDVKEMIKHLDFVTLEWDSTKENYTFIEID